MFTKLSKQIEKFRSLSENELMKYLSENQGLKEEIIYLNTYGQLWEKGVDSEDISLGQYSPYTIEIKEKAGQRTDHITLNDTGAFYSSFKVSLTSDYELLITSQPIKDNTNLLKEYGADIIGLTEDSLVRIRLMVKFIALNYIKRTIQ